MSLIEQDAVRFAVALDEYELVTVTDIGGNDDRYEVGIRDERFDINYVIASHFDYWDFSAAFVRSVPAANSGGGTAA